MNAAKVAVYRSRGAKTIATVCTKSDEEAADQVHDESTDGNAGEMSRAAAIIVK
jgi:hypothetical protein